MKKLFVAILMVMVMVGCIAMQPIETKIERVVEIQGYEKDYIYDSVRMWIAENFKSAKRVIEYEDKATDIIIGNGSTAYPQRKNPLLRSRPMDITFTMRIDVKNNKFRITFMNLGLYSPSSYSVWTGRIQGYEGPLTNQAQFDVVKPKLLAFGDEIKLYIERNSKKKYW